MSNNPIIKIAGNKSYRVNFSSQPQSQPPSQNRRGVSIITCTERPAYLQNILQNFLRQDFTPKELIIIINNNAIDLGLWRRQTAEYPRVRVLRVDERIGQGSCLNYAAHQASYDYVAKFDDDDYYSPTYLSNSVAALENSGAGLVGKASWFLYFEGSGTLALFSPGNEDTFVDRVTGATMLIRKSILKRIRFRNLDAGEDVEFCRDCTRNNIRIYATDRYNFVGIRRLDVDSHTWQDSEERILEDCVIIAHTDDYQSIASRP
jgi:cellulose synthase/poly-beta-1,6-N-acetylglucosamine synthase-like glycosyltransferase